jgi:hypothetical protein
MQIAYYRLDIFFECTCPYFRTPSYPSFIAFMIHEFILKHIIEVFDFIFSPSEMTPSPALLALLEFVIHCHSQQFVSTEPPHIGGKIPVDSNISRDHSAGVLTSTLKTY